MQDQTTTNTPTQSKNPTTRAAVEDWIAAKARGIPVLPFEYPREDYPREAQACRDMRTKPPLRAIQTRSNRQEEQDA